MDLYDDRQRTRVAMALAAVGRDACVDPAVAVCLCGWVMHMGPQAPSRMSAAA